MNLDVYSVGVKFRDNNQFYKGIRTWYKHTKKTYEGIHQKIE